MAFLLKIGRTTFSGEIFVVSTLKSTKLSNADQGKLVFVWLDDLNGQKSRLHAVGTLAVVEEVEMPQVRNPDKSKPAYRLHLSNLSTNVRLPLTTDDLTEYRYSDGTSGIERLGKIHRDRNDKIISLSSAEVDELMARFGK